MLLPASSPMRRALYRALRREVAGCSAPLRLQLATVARAWPPFGHPLAAQLPQVAELTQFLRAQRTYVRLLARYGGAGDSDVEAAARRVGLLLPSTFVPTPDKG